MVVSRNFSLAPSGTALAGNTLFIAGETGLVGSALVRRYASEGFVILSAPHSCLDLCDAAATHRWFAHYRPDWVIMAAGRVGGIGANMADPRGFYRDNWHMAQNILSAATQNGVQKLLYLGSSCMYPRNAPQPLIPDYLGRGRIEKTNQGYALAKLKALQLCRKYRATGHDIIAALPCNLYGPGECRDIDSAHVIPAITQKIKEAKRIAAPTISLWGTGTPLREFLHVDDLAEACVLLMKHYSAEVPVNIGSGVEISIRELAHQIAQSLGYKGDIIFDSTKPDGTPRKVMDSSPLQAMGWRIKRAGNRPELV